MPFKMVCPKCGSLNYSVERDGRSYIRTGPSSELIFSCRCGKQLFGDQLTEEFERQRTAYEAQAEERVAAERQREQQAAADKERDAKMAKALEFRENYLREQRAQVEEQSRAQKAEKDRKWRQRVSQSGGNSAGSTDDDDLPLPPGTPPNKPGHMCGWGPCPNEARSNSKYCSRACSNKNARWRHKQRKKS